MGVLNFPYRAFLRKVRSRQVVLFLAGLLLGCALQLLSGWYQTAHQTTVSSGGDAVSDQVEVTHRSWPSISFSPSPAEEYLSGTSQPRKPRSHNILRWAKDEVRMFEILRPMVHHSQDELSAASATTWFRDFGEGASDVDLFIPVIPGSLIKQKISTARSVVITTIKDEEKHKSESEHIVSMLQLLCNEVHSRRQSGHGPSPRLHKYKWFALAHDYSYVSSRKVVEFVSQHESTDSVCFAHQRGTDSREGSPVWSTRPGFLLNQKAVAASCPLLVQYSHYLASATDKEEMLSALFRASNMGCTTANKNGVDVFVDIREAKVSQELGRASLGEIAAFRDGILFSVDTDVQMYLLRRSDKLEEIAECNRKVHQAYHTLVDMQGLMRKYPLKLSNSALGLVTNVSFPTAATLSGASVDVDAIWMSVDIASHYQLSANFEGIAGSQRSAAISKDVETQAEFACNYLKSQKEAFACVNVISAYVRFRPSLGMEYRFNLVVKSASVEATKAKPQYQSVTMVRRLGHMKYSSWQELNIRTPLYIVLPLSHAVSFQSFMFMYERAVLSKQVNTILVIAHFGDIPDEKPGGIVDPRTLITLYINKYHSAQIKWFDVSGKEVNLVRALSKVTGDVPDDDVMLILDSSMRFDKQFLARCKLTAEQGHQAYMPVAQPATNAKSRCQVREALCVRKHELKQSGALSAGSGSLDDIVGKLKQQLLVVQAPDPDLNC